MCMHIYRYIYIYIYTHNDCIQLYMIVYYIRPGGGGQAACADQLRGANARTNKIIQNMQISIKLQITTT